MDYAPIARIVVRYIVGLVVGSDTAGIIAADPDVIPIVAIGIGVAVEGIYTLAKKREWKL
jgi:hypothetical protein